MSENPFRHFFFVCIDNVSQCSKIEKTSLVRTNLTIIETGWFLGKGIL